MLPMQLSYRKLSGERFASSESIPPLHYDRGFPALCQRLLDLRHFNLLPGV